VIGELEQLELVLDHTILKKFIRKEGDKRNVDFEPSVKKTREGK